MNHAKSLADVVKAAKAMLPKKQEAERIAREIQRQEDRAAAQQPSNTIGDTDPEE